MSGPAVEVVEDGGRVGWFFAVARCKNCTIPSPCVRSDPFFSLEPERSVEWDGICFTSFDTIYFKILAVRTTKQIPKDRRVFIYF